MQFNIVIQHFITNQKGVSGEKVFSNQKEKPPLISPADKMKKSNNHHTYQKK